MGVFRFLGRNLAKPYVRAVKDVTGSGRRIKSAIEEAKTTLKEEKERLDYFDAESGKHAFEMLYEKNQWDEAQLASQRKAVIFSKRIALAYAAMLMALFFLIGFKSNSPYITLFGCGFTLMGSFFYVFKALQYAIFQFQIDNRCLIKFDEFMGRADFWKRLFF